MEKKVEIMPYELMNMSKQGLLSWVSLFQPRKMWILILILCQIPSSNNFFKNIGKIVKIKKL